MTMRNRPWVPLTLIIVAAAACAAFAPYARADVTVGQKTSMQIAGIDIDIDSVEHTSADKQRRDSTMTCHGFLSFFCRGQGSGRIVRLDKKLEWVLQPKKMLYSERRFPTPEQRAQAQQQLEAEMQEMKSCPMPPSAAPSKAPDTSQCQLTQPVLDVTSTDQHATILGHDARKTDVLLSQTCTDPKTGDVCEIRYDFETWLTQDAIPGLAQQARFERSYLAAQGLDPSDPRLQHAMQQFMAPYADTLRQLQGKAADLKGVPLRTTFYMAFGGPHCGKAQQAQQQQASSSSSGGFSMHSLASHALAGGLAGLFHRGAAAIHSDSLGGAAASGAANETADPAADAAANSVAGSSAGSAAPGSAAPAAAGPYIRVISLTTETTSIDTASISPDEFEIPAGWSLEPPPPASSANKTFKCPTAGK